MEQLAEMAVAPRSLSAWDAVTVVLRGQVAEGRMTADNAVDIALGVCDRFTDDVLNSGAGAEVRPILERLFLDRDELLRNGFDNHGYWETAEEKTHVMEAAAESPSPSQEKQIKEAYGSGCPKRKRAPQT
ncbi:hypothetical protein [Mycolicibacterium bacteremicum]|nr:hypothetical protein [Mycolicibacterium bacteremicum]